MYNHTQRQPLQKRDGQPFRPPLPRLAFRPDPMRTFIRLLTNLVASHLAVLLAWVRLQAARVRHAFGERK